MDDRSFFNSFINGFFKPFIFTFQQDMNELPLESNVESKDERNEVVQEGNVSPRDSLLKPEKKSQFENPTLYEERRDSPHFPYSHSDREFGNSRNDEPFSDFFSHNFFNDSGMNSLFSMMDEMFESAKTFHSGVFEGGFHDFPGFSNVPSLDSRPFEEEKRDQDLDESSGNEIASLLKKSPQYDHKSSDPRVPFSSSRFHSTSIVRVRRPDGTIEETRKYRDSEGREETEIITREPSAEDNGQPVEPFPDPSFSKFFKNFPFSIF